MVENVRNLILLVDDDPSARSVRKLVLETHGHAVRAVADAEVALQILKSEPVGLVILDYFLDSMTGTQLAQLMRQIKPEVPILLLSGSSDLPPGREHVDDYFCKLEPVHVIERKIAELLQRRKAPRTIDRPAGDPKSGKG